MPRFILYLSFSRQLFINFTIFNFLIYTFNFENSILNKVYRYLFDIMIEFKHVISIILLLL